MSSSFEHLSLAPRHSEHPGGRSSPRIKRFGRSLYRWLPARSKMEANFLFFWTRTPEGFEGVDDIRLENGRLRVFDKRSGKKLTLKVSQPLWAIR